MNDESGRRDAAPQLEGTPDFPVVGIGASAGGIRALKTFFEHVPCDSGMAYVVILHLSPDHESRLAQVLQGAAAIPVVQISERVEVERDHVYVISPDRHLTLVDGHIEVSPNTSVGERRAPVDIFFRTLAESLHDRAICVVLSGTGADGSMGLKRVKERGGAAFVQAPDEAEFAEMPRNSIATGLMDEVLSVAAMPDRIIAYRRGLVNVVHTPDDGGFAGEELALREIFAEVRKRTGNDFSNYKRGTLLRRIARRMAINEIDTVGDYAEAMRSDPGETNALLKDFLISVTNFFRDEEAFHVLERDVVPALFRNKTSADEVRVWAAACATGEEAYSLAMICAELAADLPDPPKICVFATDIDEAAIAAARAGVYTLADIADVSPERLRRFFVREQDRYIVRRELRDLVLFAVHNVLKDPPFSRLDLVACRNLLIYLNLPAQERVLGTLHFALKPGGYLMLGKSESIDDSGDLYAVLDREQHLFQARQAGARLYPVPLHSAPRHSPARSEREPAEHRPTERISFGELHQQLLEQYAPPSIVVNEEHRIVHVSARAGRYLQIAGGEPTSNLLELIRPELRLELLTVLFQAGQRRTNVEAKNLVVHHAEGREAVNIHVRPVLRPDDPARGFFLILFEPAAQTARDVEPLLPGDEPLARQLEEQLGTLKMQLRLSTEQYELQAEELKASNEELQAMNEELRSSTEELETSREEVQSMNEELTTVNQELKVKVDELVQVNNHFRNLIDSTQIGTLFLDRHLRVNVYTPAAREIFNLIPTDAGRPLSDLSHRLDYERLTVDCERVLQTLQRVEQEVLTVDRRCFLMGVAPYRTTEDRIDGVVITFVETTELKRAQARLISFEERFRVAVDSLTDRAIFTTSRDGIIDSWNQGAERVFGFLESEAVGQNLEILYKLEDRAAGVPADELRRAREDGRAADERWHLRKDGTEFYASGAVAPIREGNALVGYVKMAHDLTELRRAQDDLEARVEARTRELAAANHLLRQQVVERQLAEDARLALLRRVVNAQEDERRRVSRELHDQLGQQVSALSLKLSMLRAGKNVPDKLREPLQAVEDLAKRLDSEIDFLVWRLRPTVLDDLGLVDALSEFVAGWSRHFGTPATFRPVAVDSTRLDSEAETVFYRIAQEALTNVAKHATAKSVEVVLERTDGEMVLTVRDDGCGFDMDVDGSRSLGIVGMRERASLAGGSLSVDTGAGKGTTVTARMPLQSRTDG